MSDLIIAPSVLSLDYSRMEQQIRELNESNAGWLHFDVMDGHFVPNLSFGPDLLKGFKKACRLFMDVHLMVEDPGAYVDAFANAGADLITFHVEALDNNPEEVEKMLDRIHQKGIQAGFSIKPDTPLTPFEPLLDKADLVLVMSVEPGFGGQSFQQNQLKKVRWLRDRQPDHHYRIEIDGGINNETAKQAIENGADTLVAGSYVFKRDIKEAIDSLIGEQQ